MLRHPILSVRPPTTTFASLGLNLEDRQTQLSNDTILPVSIDSERLEQDLPKIFRQAISDEGTNVRRDPTLRHFGLTADMAKVEEEGQFWIIAGGDLVLSASSQVLTSSLSCPAVRISCLSAVFYFLFLVARS